MVYCFYGQVVVVLYFIVQRKGGYYNVIVGRVDLESEFFVVFYDVVYYVSIVI